MLADSPSNRRNIRLAIVCLQLYPTLCLSYTICALLAKRWPGLNLGCNDHLSNPILLTVCVPEAAFYIFFLWYARCIPAAVHPPLRTRDERMRLFEKVLSEVHDLENFMSGWFCGAKLEDIGLDEVKIWLDWALWEGRAREGKNKANDIEIDEYVQKIEELVGKRFQEGPGKARSLRLTLDPVTIEPR